MIFSATFEIDDAKYDNVEDNVQNKSGTLLVVDHQVRAGYYCQVVDFLVRMDISKSVFCGVNIILYRMPTSHPVWVAFCCDFSIQSEAKSQETHGPSLGLILETIVY